MTERDYLRELGKEVSFNNFCLRSLELAKEHGAKFDPERIELPELSIGDYDCLTTTITLRQARSLADNTYSKLLTREQALEVIRRCELIPRIRSYVSNQMIGALSPSRLQDLLNIIDDKK